MTNIEVIAKKIKQIVLKLKENRSSILLPGKEGIIMERDIFEDIKRKLGLAYISDLKYNPVRVTAAINQMDMSSYSEKQIVELKNYIEK